MAKSLLVIIPYWHGEAYQKACLQSIANSELHPEHVVTILIVYNGGAYPKYEAAPNLKITVINASINIGFSRAVNVGLHYAFHHRPDFVAVLNQDTILSKLSLQKLLNSIDHSLALYSPLILNYDMSSVPVLHLRKYHPDVDLTSPDGLYEVPLISGACMIGTLDSFEHAGYFDIIFRMYYEDDDYVSRFAQRGGKLFLVKSAMVGHFGRSTEEAGGSNFLERRASSLKFIARHSSVFSLIRKCLVDYGSCAKRLRMAEMARYMISDLRLPMIYRYLKHASFSQINKRALEIIAKDLPG